MRGCFIIPAAGVTVAPAVRHATRPNAKAIRAELKRRRAVKPDGTPGDPDFVPGTHNPGKLGMKELARAEKRRLKAKGK